MHKGAIVKIVKWQYVDYVAVTLLLLVNKFAVVKLINGRLTNALC